MKGSAENQHSVSLQDFFEHFKVVYSENSDFLQDFVEQFFIISLIVMTGVTRIMSSITILLR